MNAFTGILKLTTLYGLASFALLVLACVSCTRQSYLVPLDDAEALAPGTKVFLDQKPIGEVTEITRQQQTRVARFVISIPDARDAIRVGTERQDRNSMSLSSSSVNPGAAVLIDGASIPTRSPLKQLANSSTRGAYEWTYRLYTLHPALFMVAILVLALLLACLLRVAFSRRVCSGLVLACGLAGASSATQAEELGYSRQYLKAEQNQFQDQIKTVRDKLDAAQERLAVGWTEAAERDVISAAILLDQAEVSMLGHEARVRALRPSSLAYNREQQIRILSDNFHELQSRQRQLADEVEGLRRAHSPPAKGAWKALLLYCAKRQDFAREFQEHSLSAKDLLLDIEKLQGCPPALILIRMITAQNASSWEKTGANTWRSPGGQEFTRDDEAIPNPVTSAPAVTNKIVVTVTNTLTITNLERVIVEHPATNDFQISSRLDLLRADIASLKTGMRSARPLTGATNKTEKIATGEGPGRTQFATPPLAAIITSPLPTNVESGRLAVKPGIVATPSVRTNSAPGEGAALEEASNTTRTKALVPLSGSTHRERPAGTTRLVESASPFRRVQVIAAILGLVGVFAFLVLFYGMRIRADEPFVIKFLIDGRERDFDVEAGRDAVFLNTEVFSAEKNSPHPWPRVLITRKGAILQPPKGGASAEGDVRVNGAPVSNACVLQPGDVIILAHPDQPNQSIKFLGHAEAVPAVDEAEIQYAPTNSTQ